LRRNQTASLPSHDDEHDDKKQKRNQEISFHTMKIKKPLLVQRLFKIRVVTCYLIPKAFFTFGT
jgi:hypothetical protein